MARLAKRLNYQCRYMQVGWAWEGMAGMVSAICGINTSSMSTD